MSLRFQVLGPVRAWRNGRSVELGSPQQRLVLAALVLAAPQPVTSEKLTRILWEDTPPASAGTALRTYVSRLRRSLGAATLTTTDGGYGITECDSDSAEFASLLAAADSAADDEAHELLRRATRLWASEALAGLAGAFADAQRARLEERRIHALERYLALETRRGDPDAAVAELSPLCSDNPFRERLHGLLMLALHRAGRKAEALAVYQDLWRRMAEELGVEPGEAVSTLQQRLLHDDEPLATPGETRPVAALPTPAQLPPDLYDFTGRDGAVRDIATRLSADSPTPVLVTVAGVGGVGKTTLAVRAAHQVRENYPDGQFYIDLRGAGANPVEPNAVLAAFLRALGIDDSAIPDQIDERSALFRSTIDGRRLLFVLDNASDTQQVLPLLPAGRGCGTLVTSRKKLSGLPTALRADLDELGPAEAADLFAHVAGQRRVTGERPAVEAVVAACGFLPLAVRIAASRLTTRPQWTVERLARLLADDRRRLKELTSDGDAVAAAFALSYEQLDPLLAETFRVGAVPDAPRVGVEALAAMLEVEVDDAEEVAESLVDLNLLESPAPGEYRYHDLVKLYVSSLCGATERDESLHRYLDFQLATTCGARSVLGHSGHRMHAGLTPVRHNGTPFPGRDRAEEWLEAEPEMFLPVVRQAAAISPQCTALAADLVRMFGHLYSQPRYTLSILRAAEAVVAAAESIDDPRSEARARQTVCYVNVAFGDVTAFQHNAERTREQAARAGDTAVYIEAVYSLSEAASDRERYDEAIAFREEAMDLLNRNGWTQDAAVARIYLADDLASMGRTEEALVNAREAVAGLRRHGDEVALPYGLKGLSQVLIAAREYDEAATVGHEAAAILKARGRPLVEAACLALAARAHLLAGRPERVLEPAERALELIDGLRAKVEVDLVATLGDALTRLGHSERAQSCLRRAVELSETRDALSRPHR